MSGSGTSPFLTNCRRPATYARTFAESLGVSPTLPDDAALAELRKVPVKSVVAKTTLFKDFHAAVPCPWKPVVDGGYASKPFLPRPFAEALAAGDFDKSVPVLALTCSEEGLIMSVPFYQKPRLWGVLFDDWAKWGAQYFFGKESGLLTEQDRAAMGKLRQRYTARPV